MQSNDILLDPGDPSSGLELFFQKNKTIIIFILTGLVFICGGIFYWVNGNPFSSSKVEIIEEKQINATDSEKVVVEISGEVNKPGVYELPANSRVENLLSQAGGLKESADRNWVEKYINRAAKLADGQKLYIKGADEQLDVLSANSASNTTESVSGNVAENSGLVNINTASLSGLDTLPGIGLVYGQNIIDHRPYSSVEELLSRGILKKNVYEKIKDKVSVY